MMSGETPKLHNGDQDTPSKLESQTTQSMDLESNASSELPCNFCHDLCLVHSKVPKEHDHVDFQWGDSMSLTLDFDLFHTECDKCSSGGSEAPICSFCAHLRPRHLFSHALPLLCSQSSRNDGPYIFLGDLGEIRTRAPDCEFCDFLARHPRLFHLAAWTRIGILFYESRLLLFANSAYTGDLFLDTRGVLATQACSAIQWDLIKGWLVRPPNQPSCGASSPGQIFDCFRLIDVIRNCVVRISEPTSYASLSYVWGNSAEASFKATKHTVSALECEDGLASVNIPVTIQDAMFATKELGLRYLWADRICIVQDDDDSKLPQIYRMDLIFASSYVTLVAEGQDAMVGLPGVQLDREKTIQTAHWDGMTVGFPYWPHLEGPRATSGLHWDPGRSEWYKRGWTYQEAVVSKLLLHFTHEGVFLESDDNDTILVEGGTHGSRKRWSTYSHPDFYEAVQEITTRDLTYPSDILLSFQGILNWIVEKQCRTEKSHRFGIPFEEFDLAIQWHSTYTAPERSSDNRQIFPSWSWTSVEGPIYFYEISSSFGSLATWAFCEQSANNQFHLVPVVSRPKAFCDNWESHGGVYADFMITAWGGGWEGRHFPKGVPSDLRPAEDNARPATLRFPTYDDFWKASRGEQWHQNIFSSDDLKIASLQPERLLLHTQCALLDLEYKKDSPDGGALFGLKDPSGNYIGSIRLPSEPQKLMSSFSNRYMRTKGMRMEFFALTLYSPCPEQMIHFSDDFFRFSPGLTVMLVHRCGLVARRLGIGFVTAVSWLQMDREFKTIILE